MEKKEKVGLVVVALLGLVCAGLDFAAEANRIKIRRTSTRGVCVYISRYPALYYATPTAAIFLFGTLIFSTLVRKKDTRPTSAAVACLNLISFCTYMGAQLLHLIYIYNFTYKCTLLRRGVCAAAGILSLVSVMFGIAYSYYYLLSAKNSNTVPQIGIAMGQPIPSTVTQDPVFVHEDTHIRRQFT